MKKGFDDTKLRHLKNSDYAEMLEVFCEVEGMNNILERIETNASTFKMFRKMERIIEQTTMREVRRGLFGRLWTAEIWLNNELKEGQLKLFFNPIESLEKKIKDPEEPVAELKMPDGL